jgi:RNA polymerase sigma-70 factor (ECF subfamily)
MQDEVLMRQQQMDRIHAIIQQLPEKQRTIILLRDIEEKSYQEIAEIMGINLSDVKVNLFRARQTLKAKINKS